MTAIEVAMTGGLPLTAIVDLGVLVAFTAAFFGLATWALARRLA
jgi:type IV secretory pathway TrbD component